MGLRGRLALFFVVITIAPMTVGMAGVQAQSTAQLRDRLAGELARAGASAAALVEAARLRADDLADDLAIRDGLAGALTGPAAAEAWLDRQPAVARAGVTVLATPEGQLLAARRPEPPGGQAPETVAGAAAVVAARPDAPAGELLLAVRVVADAGLVAVAVWLDEALLGQVAHDPPPGSGAAFVADGRVLAATGPAPAVSQLPPAGQVEDLAVDGESTLVWVQDLVNAPGSQLVLWAPRPGPPGLGLRIAVLTLAVVAAAGIGWWLARSVIAPVQRAADVARAVAGGDLSQRLQPSGGRELTDLGEALNTMTTELATRLAEVERSRDELRRSLSRLGDALSGSLDLDRMLTVVVETAATTLRADGAAILLPTGDGDALDVKAARGWGATGRVDRYEEVAAGVVRTGQPVLLADRATASPARAATEPDEPYLLAVPFQGRGRTNGALVLVRDEAAGPFDEVDLDTARGIATGVAVAIDNVRLHEETERLSLTNPVTGLWNIRYFEPQADKELERARRANEGGDGTRTVSVLAIDLDHFGRINKEYDQAAGDAALAEVGRRLQEATRDPDVVTHPHGEEFAVLLPDTGYDGALQVAERMRSAVGHTPLALPVGSRPGTVDLRVTCSVGVATFPQHAHDRATLYRAADRAMQRAKEQGRDRVVGAEELGPAE
ncbi:MAG: diguanylate cyclase [Egibacteraceae bacterium]